MLLIEGWSKDGLTNEQIAHNMGVNRATLYKWQNKSNNIEDALKRGKEVADREVENALFNKAIGYEYTEEQLANNGDVVTVTKYMKPDTTSQIFWLKNRKPKEWRDKQNIEHDANIEINNAYANLTEDELRSLANYED